MEYGICTCIVSMIIVFGYYQVLVYGRSREEQSCNLGFRQEFREDMGEQNVEFQCFLRSWLEMVFCVFENFLNYLNVQFQYLCIKLVFFDLKEYFFQDIFYYCFI